MTHILELALIATLTTLVLWRLKVMSDALDTLTSAVGDLETATNAAAAALTAEHPAPPPSDDAALTALADRVAAATAILTGATPPPPAPPPVVVANWDATTTYSAKDEAVGSDGQTYQSVADNNTGNDPTVSGPNFWMISGAPH